MISTHALRQRGGPPKAPKQRVGPPFAATWPPKAPLDRSFDAVSYLLVAFGIAGLVFALLV
jgi:hypothetical protein